MHLDKCLQDLEERIDEGVEEELLASWKEFTDNRFRGEVFVPARRKAATAKVVWPKVLINDALEDYDLMALAQFAECSQALEKAGGAVMMVRSDYGTSILPSLFGVRLFIMERDLDTRPTSDSAAGFGGHQATRRPRRAGPSAGAWAARRSRWASGSWRSRSATPKSASTSRFITRTCRAPWTSARLSGQPALYGHRRRSGPRQELPRPGLPDLHQLPARVAPYRARGRRTATGSTGAWSTRARSCCAPTRP